MNDTTETASATTQAAAARDALHDFIARCEGPSNEVKAGAMNSVSYLCGDAEDRVVEDRAHLGWNDAFLLLAAKGECTEGQAREWMEGETLERALLILAARDLLDGTVAFLDAWDGIADEEKMDRALALARAAVAKATGGQS